MKNNKAFILLDALCSFMLLSSSIIFFNQMIYINNQQTLKITNQITALNILRENMYDDYKVTKTEEFETFIKGNKYCCNYKNEQVCIDI